MAKASGGSRLVRTSEYVVAYARTNEGKRNIQNQLEYKKVYAGRMLSKHKIQEASPRVANRSSPLHERVQIKFAAAILVEFFFFCGPAGSLGLAPAAPAQAVFRPAARRRSSWLLTH